MKEDAGHPEKGTKNERVQNELMTKVEKRSSRTRVAS